MERNDGLTRREASAYALAGAGALATAGEAMAATEVVETDVSVKTPDGTADAALFHPGGAGAWPGVVIFPDALGLRPAFRDMGRRLAQAGYVVLVPNPFYRTRKAPVIDGPFDFANPTDRAKLTELRAPLTPEAVSRDAGAYVDFVAAQKATKKGAKIGTQGYCMGGPMTFRAAAVRPDKVGAAASFHGGGLTTDAADSPHKLIPSTKASYLVAIADNDDKREPDSKTKLREAFDAAKRPAVVEVYTGADHGWCVKGSAVYQEAAAEKAWTELLALYTRALV